MVKKIKLLRIIGIISMLLIFTIMTAAAIQNGYTGFNFSITTNTPNAGDIVWIEPFFLIPDNTGTAHVDRYNSTGSFNSSYTASVGVGTVATPRGITANATVAWVCSDANPGYDMIYGLDVNSTKGYPNDDFRGFNFSIADQIFSTGGGCEGLTKNLTHFMVLDGINVSMVYIYNSTGNYEGKSFNASDAISPVGIVVVNNYIYVLSQTRLVVYEYDLSGQPTSFNFSVANTTSPTGITWNGSSFFVVDDRDGIDLVYEFAIDFLPSFNANYSNITILRFGNNVGYNVNFSDDLGFGNGIVETNITGSVINQSVQLTGLAQNVTFNFTIELKYSGSSNINTTYFKIYVNDSAGQTKISEKVLFSISSNIPIITHQSQFINLTQHGFNVSASFNDADGISDFVNRSITFTSGACNYLTNKTIGSTGFNLTFNCTGTPFNSNSVVISMNDSSLSAVSTTSTSNIYPNTVPILINVTVNNSPISTQNANLSWNYADLDNDTEGGFTIYWYKNGVVVTTANNSRYLASNNYTTDDLINASVNVTDGFESSLVYNTLVVTVGDATPPEIRSFVIQYNSLYTDETNNFTIIVNDTSSNIQSCNFDLNMQTSSVNRNFGIPSNQKNITVSYKIFEAIETASKGTYNVTQVQCVDSSTNTNTTTVTSINFSVATRPTPDSDSPGTGGSSSPEPSIPSDFRIEKVGGKGVLDMLVYSGIKKEVPFLIFNDGNRTTKISFKCLGELCKYVKFKEQEITLIPAGIGYKNYFNISIPKNAIIEKTDFSIIGYSGTTQASLKVVGEKQNAFLVKAGSAMIDLFLISKFPVAGISIPFLNFLIWVLPLSLFVYLGRGIRKPRFGIYVLFMSLLSLTGALVAVYYLRTGGFIVS